MIGFQSFQQKSRTYCLRWNYPSCMATLLAKARDFGCQIVILLSDGNLQRFNHYVERMVSIDSPVAV